jgi:hypothetical protein
VRHLAVGVEEEDGGNDDLARFRPTVSANSLFITNRPGTNLRLRKATRSGSANGPAIMKLSLNLFPNMLLWARSKT